jgi:FecR protein
MLLRFHVYCRIHFRVIAITSRTLAFVFAVWFPATLSASPAKEAQMTVVVKDVTLLSPEAGPRPAVLKDELADGTSAQTGSDSRAELTFANRTIARLGPNTFFSFNNGTRNLNLKNGAILLRAPRSTNGVKIYAEGLGAVVTATTAVFEYQPSVYKFLVLEGTARLFRPGHRGDSVLVRAGQMVFGKPNTPLSDPVDFDIARFVKTCRFIVDFPPLGSETLIANESRKQERAKTKKVLIDTNLVIFGGGTLVSLVDPAKIGANQETVAPAAPASSPAPTATPLAASH